MSSIVFIKTIDEQTPKLYRLSLTDDLSNIRKELEKYNIINDTLLFSKKSEKSENEFSEILHEYEEKLLLKEIIDNANSCNYLYLIKNSRPSWKILNEKCKLDYGCTMSFDGIKKADNRAFIMKDCELTEIDTTKGYKKGELKFKSKEDWMRKTNLFTEGDDANIMSFVNLGISIKGLRDENFNNEIKLKYQYTELGKLLLKFNKKNLVLTEDFENDINDAIKSKDPRKFRKITKEYGQFIPTEIILGGRVYYKDFEISLESSAGYSGEGSINASSKFLSSAGSFSDSGASVGPLNCRIGGDFSDSNNKSNFYSFSRMRLLGGTYPDGENFDEKSWIKSLNDYQKCECIELKNPVSIFQLLSDDLRRASFKSIGKKILYTSTETYNYGLYELGRHEDFELKNIPENILDIILNEEADCDIFAAVVNANDNSKKVFFNCQIFRELKAKPSIIIHGIQEKFQRCKYQLKINIMIIGYDINFNHILSDTIVRLNKEVYYAPESPCFFNSMKLQFECDLITKNKFFLGIPILSNLDSSNNSLIIGHNFCNTNSNNKFRTDTFSYCLKGKYYVNLPKFTFCTIVISSNTTPNNSYESFLFEFNRWKNPNPFVDFKEPNPRFISLYLSKDDNYNPIFLNQRSKQISIEYIDCNCSKNNKTCFICKSKKSKVSAKQNNIECKVYSIR
ncbi:hypothetical protein RirG_084490 [Rhizophagus irregularis DAOM 197198w]|uniref:DUF7431 domain-containing protein n=1 Tax=Rhizophagus irregularis (strain DAOM 197198w) TaxID=1432141 RepID=A0A015JMP9_RHIIW|nr:hypothetical protein RirG_084490 [Rhizophagus irregularis DAOM 197198w]